MLLTTAAIERIATLIRCDMIQIEIDQIGRKFLKFSQRLQLRFRSKSHGVKAYSRTAGCVNNSGRKESFPVRRGVVTFVLSGAEGDPFIKDAHEASFYLFCNLLDIKKWQLSFVLLYFLRPCIIMVFHFLSSF